MPNYSNERQRIVRINELSLTYQSEEGEIEALRDISFDVRQGEIVSVIGPSGCGKSTLLSILAGLLKPSGGEAVIEGGGTVGYMLQRDSLFPWRTIWQNVLLGAEILGDKDKNAAEIAEKLLKTYGLWEFKDSRPSRLSGGMRQRAALIRTLAVNPRLLLLDEAFSALDYQTRLAVSDDIASIIRREEKTALMVTHDISEAISMSDRVVVLSRRPAVVKNVYDISFKAGRGTPMQCREREEFKDYFNMIWRDIDVHV